MKESMFCFQCQETAKGTGCTVRGVCGKNSTTSARMDLLLFVIRGISIAAHTLRTHRILPDPQVNAFVIDALFSTITNANFDEKASPSGSIGGSIFATVWLLRHRQPASPFLRPTN